MRRRFTQIVFAAMVLGILVGWACHAFSPTPAAAKAIAGDFSLITDIFLRLIRMIIAPLVFSTLVVGIAHMGDSASIGRVGIKTLGWFVMAGIVSLALGAVMVSLLQPGAGLHLVAPAASAGPVVDASTFTLKDFIAHVFPRSIVEAMANNEILQIVVFSIFVGSAIAALNGEAPAILALAEQIAAVMLKVTGYVMWFAPAAIFAALAATVATEGLGVLLTFAAFVGGFYLSLLILWCVLVFAAFLVIGRRAGPLAWTVREPVILAFSTASSEAAYPRTLEALQRFGVSRRIVSFVLPLGYSFNLDGSMMYCTFATLFIAQAYGVTLSFGQLVTMLLLFMLTSKGMAGVPRASLVVIAAALTYFKLPDAGLLLILTVDHLLDMGRSATNVVGNSVAAAVVGKWEGQLGPPVAATQDL
ncbi:MAG: dicarboxylate/amino acid:cation symporter [Caulobacteraceae bacterium]